MKIAFIHQEKKIHTGANYINSLIANKLKQCNVKIKNFYPKHKLIDAPVHLKGLNNILFFHGLLENKDEILKCDLIHGTTYTPLAFLPFEVPVLTHFGSQTSGFLRSVPKTNLIINKNLKKIWYELKNSNIIDLLNIKTRKPMRDITEIENYVAQKANAVIATSDIVKSGLENSGVESDKIYKVHNAIEDFWFNGDRDFSKEMNIIYIGRLGSDVFTHKLKGLDRLVHVYKKFHDIPKKTFFISNNGNLIEWFKNNFSNHESHSNVLKSDIKKTIAGLAGSVLLIPSRYEGFCLSLVEGMSQGLIPISYKVGVAPEIIRHGENGFLINKIDEAEKIILELKDNISLRKKLAFEAEETSKQFKANGIIKKLVGIYNEVLEKDKVQKILAGLFVFFSPCFSSSFFVGAEMMGDLV